MPVSALIAVALFGVIAGDMAHTIGITETSWMSWVLFAIYVPWIVTFPIVLWDWVRSGGSD